MGGRMVVISFFNRKTNLNIITKTSYENTDIYMTLWFYKEERIEPISMRSRVHFFTGAPMHVLVVIFGQIRTFLMKLW